MGLAAAQVLRWQLDLEQNCDVFVCVEEWALHQKNIYSMVYSPQLNCLITGSEDNTIHMHYLHSEWGGGRQGPCTAGAAVCLWDYDQCPTLLGLLQ